jgi:hypothetical protein
MRRRIIGACAALIVTVTGCGARGAAEPGADGLAQPTAEQAPAASEQPRPARHHVDIRGLYMTGYTAGSPRFYELVDYMLHTGLNAVVIDAMDDDGLLSWPTDIPLAGEIGANTVKVADIAERVAYLLQRGIYPIARVVVYADPLLGRKRPDLAILQGNFIDARGIRWPDPYNREVWAYKVAVAKEAAARGFREIQFDYIRFPERRIEGYNYLVPVRQRTAAVEGFLRYAKEELEPLGVFLSADVFGLTTSVAEGDDMEIGQEYAAIARIVDYIKPMVYPSHYAPFTFGIPDPNRDPRRIVRESLIRAQMRTIDLPAAVHRPWIQDFTYGKVYTAADIEAQILGLAEAGIYQWILWDPHNRYTRSVRYDVAGPPPAAEPAWRAALRREWELGRLTVRALRRLPARL